MSDPEPAAVTTELALEGAWSTAEVEVTAERSHARFGAPEDSPVATRAATRTRAPGLVEVFGTGEHPSPGWGPALRDVARGARAGFEAVVLAWLVVVVPVVAGYIATVAAPVLGESSWMDAARSGTRLWLLGLGEPYPVTAATPATAAAQAAVAAPAVTLVPLALTALTGWLLVGAIGRAQPRGIVVPAAAAVTAGLGVVGGYALAGATPSTGGVLVATGVILMAAIAGWLRSGAVPWPTAEPASWVLAGCRAARTALRALLVMSLGITLLAILGALPEIAAVHRALHPDPMSAFLLVLAQLALLPTLMVWVVAWWVGPGFAIGAVSVTTAQVTSGPLPVIPVLAAVPEAGPGPGRAIVLGLVVLLALVWARSLARVQRTAGNLALAVASGCAVVITAVVIGVLSQLSSGSVGPMAAVGSSGVAVGAQLAGWALLAALVAAGVDLGLRRLGFDLLRLRVPGVPGQLGQRWRTGSGAGRTGSMPRWRPWRER